MGQIRSTPPLETQGTSFLPSSVVSLFEKRFQNDLFFSKTIFCGSIENDLFMGLVPIEVRSCISGYPYTPHKRELIGSYCCCCCCINR